MPFPFAAAALGLSVAQTGAGFFGAKKADKKAEERAEHDAELIKQQAEFQIDAILEGKEEAEKATIEKMSDLTRRAMIERGRILASAGEAGRAGASVSGQMLMTFQDEATAKGRELYNLSAKKRQLSRDVGAVQAGLQVNLPRAEKLAPSLGTSIFAGATQALQIANQFGLVPATK